MPRHPSPQLDIGRFMKRVEDRIDQSFDLILHEIDKLKFEVRKGNLDVELQGKRLSDLELQVIETRQHLQLTEQHIEQSAGVRESKIEEAPKKVWHTKFGMITAASAAFVAIVAFANNLPKFVRGATEVAVGVYQYLARHG